eukprot:TRINITY_DN788_c0_g2_i1.p2 TRINITY_DN788_c0_g2~~TRINITY_DN788_c0_g2_i1.p2  ORF type:complete len:105 (+),score=17.75 TRINITY_DN788_c0_g2_i1:205-519(+)
MKNIHDNFDVLFYFMCLINSKKVFLIPVFIVELINCNMIQQVYEFTSKDGIILSLQKKKKKKNVFLTQPTTQKKKQIKQKAEQAQQKKKKENKLKRKHRKTYII